jgi:3-isopropylmalate dehydrogenase
MPKVVVLPGDGVGPEVVNCTLEVLRNVAPDLEYQEFAFGLAGTEKYGKPLGDEVLEAALASDAVLMGSVGGLPGSTDNVARELWACTPTCARARSTRVSSTSRR